MRYWYYAYFAIFVILFFYYLLFWKRPPKIISRKRKKKFISLIDSYISGSDIFGPNKNIHQLYDLFKETYIKDGQCDYKRFHTTLHTLYERTQSPMKSSLIHECINILEQENPYYYLQKEDSITMLSVDRHLDLGEIQEAKKQMNLICDRMENSYAGKHSSLVQFWIGVLLSVLGLIPMIVEAIDWLIANTKI